MAIGSYISANVTSEQLQFLKLLDEYEVEIFNLDNIEDLLSHKFENLNEILENLVHKELLSRIEKGKFCKPTFRDENVLGTFIAKESAIAYWSALNLHGLTEQFPNTIFVQTSFKKKDKSVFGTKYKFIQIAKQKRCGIITNGYGSHTYKITDIEKTIVDCFDLPEYSGGYAELLRAFSKANLSSSKLIEYCNAVDNISIIKRMGYLAEVLNKKGMKAFIQFAKKQVNEAYSLFDPLSSDGGEYIKEWRIRLNITKEAILSMTNKEY